MSHTKKEVGNKSNDQARNEVDRFQNVLDCLKESKNIIILCREVTVSENEIEFVRNVKQLATATERLKNILENYLLAQKSNNQISIFLADLIQISSKQFENIIVETVKTTRNAMQNPCSITSYYTIYKISENVTDRLEDIFILIDLLDSLETDVKYLGDPVQIGKRKEILEIAYEISNNINVLINFAKKCLNNKQSEEENTANFKVFIYKVGESLTKLFEYLSQINDKNQNQFVAEDFKATIEAIVLFSKHMILEKKGNYSGMQETQLEYIQSIKNFIIHFTSEKIRNSQSIANKREKRGAVRVVTSKGNAKPLQFSKFSS